MVKRDRVSVIIPALISNKEQLNMSIKCIEAAKQNTEIPFELIVVETGSDYLKDYCDVHVYEKEKTTATISINRGFRVARGDYICLLTNDVFVSAGWLDALVGCFAIEACGVATLGTTQLGHVKENKIEEGIWFSVAMFEKRAEYFDENYVNSWDDADLITRIYKEGKKAYRNYNCIVEHLVRATHGIDPKHQENFNKNMEYYKKKHEDIKDSRIYKIFVDGVVI